MDIPQLDLNENLAILAAQLKADPQELIAYAAEDNLGGYHNHADQCKFPMGSLWGVEGQMLYALVRWLKPETIAEIGGWAGASASHLAAACIANKKGHVFSIDNRVGGMDHGHLLTPQFREIVTLVNANGEDWLNQQPAGSIGFLFEDADHSAALVAYLSQVGMQRLAPGGLLVNHDVGHTFWIDGNDNRGPSNVGQEVQDGLTQAKAPWKGYLSKPSDCGLSVSVMPGEWQGDAPTLLKAGSYPTDLIPPTTPPNNETIDQARLAAQQPLSSAKPDVEFVEGKGWVIVEKPTPQPQTEFKGLDQYIVTNEVKPQFNNVPQPLPQFGNAHIESDTLPPMPDLPPKVQTEEVPKVEEKPKDDKPKTKRAPRTKTPKPPKA